MLNASGGNVTVNTDPSFLTSNAEIVATSKKQANNKSDYWTVIVRPAANASSGTLTMQLGDASYTTHLTYVDTQKKAADAFIQYAAKNNYKVSYDPSIAAPQLLGYTTSRANVDASGMPDENSMYNLLEKMKDHGATKFAFTQGNASTLTSDYYTRIKLRKQFLPAQNQTGTASTTVQRARTLIIPILWIPKKIKLAAIRMPAAAFRRLQVSILVRLMAL